MGSSGGDAPRHFEIDETGNWLFSANQNSDNIILFKIDKEIGGLINTNQIYKNKITGVYKILITEMIMTLKMVLQNRIIARWK